MILLINEVVAGKTTCVSVCRVGKFTEVDATVDEP